MGKILKIRPECLSCGSFSGDTPESASCAAGHDPTCYRKKKPCADASPAREALEKATAYTDGSFNAETDEWGFGLVLVIGGKEKVFSGKGPDVHGGRQIEGEITAALCACEKAFEAGCGSLEIVYDFEGIARWALGEWKANKPYTKKYAEDMSVWQDLLSITFVHVKSHTGDAGNESADRVAKRACGLWVSEGTEGYVPDIPDDVNPECRAAIETFYGTPNPGFVAYARLKTDGCDAYSAMTSGELRDAAREGGYLELVNAAIPSGRDRDACIRWCMRGLRPKDAVRKVRVDLEIRSRRGD